MAYIHTPVLLEETLEWLGSREEKSTLVDGNIGEGGHTEAFLTRFPEMEVIGIDADEEIMEVAKKRLEKFSDRVHFYTGWSHDFFANYPSHLRKPTSILFDCGISFYHYKKSGKGFSFDKQDEYLDMRISSEGTTAADLLAKLPEKELADLIYYNSGERYSRSIASQIVKERQRGAVTTTSALVKIIDMAVPASYRHGPIHSATRTFQALRIAVNGELSRLPALLEAALGALESRGRLGIISFHSLEDRIIKNFFKARSKNCVCPEYSPIICRCEGNRSINILTKKGIAADSVEIERNPPSRSARLRVVEKLPENDPEINPGKKPKIKLKIKQEN
jgi:16S rRNA (cytosine1402-N4)-methyltransferase